MLAGFLLALIVKATLVLVATWIVAGQMARASAAARSAVWGWGLAFALSLPAFMAAVPTWSLDAFSWTPDRIGVGAAMTDVGGGEPLPVRASESRPQAAIVAKAARTAAAVISEWSSPLAVIIAVIWALGTIVMLVQLARGLASVARLAREAAPLRDPGWSTTVADGCRDLGLRRTPPILISNGVAVPAVFGVLRPTLVLPPWCFEWSLSCRRVVVLHELAHVKRRDCLAQLLADTACTLYWFHPLAHRAAAALRDERERASDDIVLEAGTCATTYADHLLDLVRVGVGLPPAPAVAFGTPSRLNHRIAALLAEDHWRTAPRTRTVLVGVAAGAVAFTLVASAQVTAQPAAEIHTGDLGGGVIARSISSETRQRAGDALAAALRDASAEVRAIAEQTIETIRSSGNTSLQVTRPCRGNCTNFAAGPIEVLDSLVQGLMNPAFKDSPDELASDDVEVRRVAVWKIWPRSERGAAALARALLDDDQAVRTAAAIRLDSVHAPVAVPSWISLLADTDPMLRERAAISLGVIGDPRAIDALADALRDAELSVRLQAARALAAVALGGEEAAMATAHTAELPIGRLQPALN